MYYANLFVSAGADFSQTFTLTEVDGSAIDITGYTITARMAKHADAINASSSTSTDPVWKYITMTTNITDAAGGEYSISLPDTTTVKLKEGKYVYSVVTTDGSSNKEQVLSGLIFVDKAFADIGDLGSLDPNYP